MNDEVTIDLVMTAKVRKKKGNLARCRKANKGEERERRRMAEDGARLINLYPSRVCPTATTWNPSYGNI